MSTILQLRHGLCAALGTIKGLRVVETVPLDPKPPVAVVFLPTVAYDQSFGRGYAEYAFTVTVIVGGQDQRTKENKISGYMDAAGALSVAAAVYADRTLGGVASDSRVTDMRGVSALSVEENTYLAAEFVVTVYA